MRFGKLMGKNVFLSMILCSVTSFSFFYANDLKECESEEDAQTGCVVKVYDESGNLTTDLPLKNGKLNGIAKDYYDNGNLKAERSFKNGRQEGIKKEYYEDGNLLGELPYKNDKAEGIFESVL